MNDALDHFDNFFLRAIILFVFFGFLLAPNYPNHVDVMTYYAYYSRFMKLLYMSLERSKRLWYLIIKSMMSCL